MLSTNLRWVRSLNSLELNVKSIRALVDAMRYHASMFGLRLCRLIFTAGLVLAFGASNLSIYAQSQEWKQFSAPDFSVLFPNTPTAMEVSRPQKLFQKMETARLYSSYEDRIVYVVLAVDNSRRRQQLSSFIDEIGYYALSAQAQNLQQELSGEGWSGKEYTFDSPRAKGIIRFYKTEKNLYALEAVGEDVNKPNVKRFLDSFVAGKKNQSESLPTISKPESENAVTTTETEVFSGRDVTTRAVVLLKPEPMYTEEARQAGTTGTVVIRAILRSDGHVSDLRAIRTLGYGLTEQAINAARNLRFIPARKDERDVSMYVQLEYNFNLY
jgi:TonB family protein